MRTVSVKKSVFARFFSNRIVKSAFNVSIGTIRAKYFLEFIKTFSNMERKFQLFVIFFRGFVKTTTYVRRWTVRWKRTIRKTYYGLIIFGQWAKSFWPSGNYFSIEFSKLRARSTKKNLREKMKKSSFSSFLVFERKVFGLLSISLLVFVKIAFYLSMGFVWINCFFEQKIVILSNSHKERTVLAFSWNFFGGVVKNASLVSTRKFSGGGGVCG